MESSIAEFLMRQLAYEQLPTKSQHHPSPQLQIILADARKQPATQEILLWMTPLEAPKALQASECSELLGLMRAN